MDQEEVMKFKIIFVVLFLGFIAGYSFGQTAKDFEKRYGSVKYYEIRPHTLIFPTFDKNGQICRASIKPIPFTSVKNKDADFKEIPDSFKKGATMYFKSSRLFFPALVLNSKELKEVFNELVPVQTRKGAGNSYRDCSGFGTHCSVRFEFENVHITTRVVLGENVVIDKIGGNLELLFDPPYGAIESADIVWTERTCNGN